MALLISGVKVGLMLAILLGPIFFALIQAGVEKGLRAGTMVGLGIWISDLFFIAAVYWGLSYINRIVQLDGFSLYLGIGGSIILAAFGLGTLLTKAHNPFSEDPLRTNVYSSYFNLWLKGFLINTVNPFTVFFWMGVISSMILQKNLSESDTLYFVAGIMGTIMITDMGKVVLAKQIRHKLNLTHVLWLRRISGLALIIFGLVLLLRVMV